MMSNSKIALGEEVLARLRSKSGDAFEKWLANGLMSPDSRRSKRGPQGLHVRIEQATNIGRLLKEGGYDNGNSLNDSDYLQLRKSRTVVPGEVYVEFLHIGREVDVDDLSELLRMHEMSNRLPLEPEYLLALGAQYPEEQRLYPIVSLHELLPRADGYKEFLQLSTTYMGREAGTVTLSKYSNIGESLLPYTRFACRQR